MKTKTLLTALLFGALSLTSVSSFAQYNKIVARDNAQMQTKDKSLPTRILNTGTKINMHFGETIIPGLLNDSFTSQELIKRLPLKVRVNRYSHDFCGVMDDPLPYREEDVHYGWLNGDIDFARDGNYFTILFEDEERSEIYGHQINLGIITCPLAQISNLSGSYEVLIELAQ